MLETNVKVLFYLINNIFNKKLLYIINIMADMRPLLYHETIPENNVNSANGFQEFNTIDFLISLDPGRALKPNSIRIEYDLQVFTNLGANPPTRVVATDNLGYENKIGGHAFFSNFRTELPQSAGLIESITEYGRYVNMVASATMPEEHFYSSHFQAEGRGVLVDNGRFGCQAINPRVLPVDQGAGAANGDYTGKATDARYVIKPLICVNRSMGGMVSANKHGPIRISVDCARVGDALFGGGLNGAANPGYALKNVKVRYQSVPEPASNPKVLMNTLVGVKTTMNSQFLNFSTRVPLKACNGVVFSAMEQSKEVGRLHNSMALERIPKLDNVQYLFSDATNKYITYKLEDLQTIVERGLDAMSDSGLNNVNATTMKANDGFVAGLGFQQYLDLSKQKFSIQINSSSNNINTQPRNLYVYFLGLLEA